MSKMIDARGLTKAFEKSNKVVDGASFSVTEGEVFSLLGPNGAGKTTTIRMLTTLTRITEGSALIGGYDVSSSHQMEVRRIIGVVPQDVTLDNELKGIENLLLAAKLQHVPGRAARERAMDLLALVDLADFAERRVATYSGGMKRRLQVVAALIHQPKILFLDEPTVGLDIQTRTKMWDYILTLKEQGKTIFMTTHYLEEADKLSDAVAIMDCGKIVVEGSPSQLKESLQGDVLTIAVDGDRDITGYLESFPGVREVDRKDHRYLLKLTKAESALPGIITGVASMNVKITETSFSKSTLDQVFLEATGRSMRDAEEGSRNHDGYALVHTRESG